MRGPVSRRSIDMWILPAVKVVFLVTLVAKIYRRSISAANQNTDALVRLGDIAAGEKRREGGCASGFGDDAQIFPKGPLRFPEGFVADQHRAADELLGDREYQFAHAPGRQRVGGDAARFGIDRAACCKGAREGGSQFGLDPYNLDFSAIPGGDTGDQAAPSYGYQERVELRGLLFQLQADRGLAE